MTIAKTDSGSLSGAEIALADFTADHIAGAMRLSQDVSWPHRAEDWALSLSLSKGVVALANGQVVGTALCTAFGPVATLNMIIVDAALRGRGLGRALMERVIALAGPREMRLVATAEGLPLYEKLGFKAESRIFQHQGIARAPVGDNTVTTGSVAKIGRLAKMDEAASGLSREPLLAKIAGNGWVLVAEQGFALIRDFGRGKVLGPVVAQETATAQALVTEAAHRCDGQFLRIDLPEGRGLSDLVETLGLASAGGGIAMRRDARTAQPTDYKTFALVSQALG
ncbi:GNAT family N-acetyltransferase [Mameliella sp. CS4]|uniref:GNAT family N-acetyltransferase n=1 Tax=Mameliella sp. CS4 TaxID=2862329 RepID=UPI001C604683|nr:GNAT family N-acetyltransferase [Mameliella sp. CS4]MBW4984192.1 GNAT family N-acetyltransferase [Mameliella sp. CS4]